MVGHSKLRLGLVAQAVVVTVGQQTTALGPTEPRIVAVVAVVEETVLLGKTVALVVRA